jgi:hypothetical protein
MPQIVEISLRIPSLRVRREGKEDLETITNSEIRFTKKVELDVIPKPAEVLTMTVGSDLTFGCEVVRTEWHHDKNLFVVECRYAKRSISATEYQAFVESPDWQGKPLL